MFKPVPGKFGQIVMGTESVSHDPEHNLLQIFGQHMVPALQKGAGLGCPQKSEAGPWRKSDGKMGSVARKI